jgi:anti-sigma regulatory factor (Ser/Thr protein kinase)
MRELSLNVLDIAQNSVAAGATFIEIDVSEDTKTDWIRIAVTDNGCGMTPEQVKTVSDPFYTTRTTRKVGMGIPLFRMAAEMAGGELTIVSERGTGTTVTATFQRSHIDRFPLGDLCSTITALIRLNPDIDFWYQRAWNGRAFVLDTREMRQVLQDVPLNTPEVMTWIEETIHEQTQGIMDSSGTGTPDEH